MKKVLTSESEKDFYVDYQLIFQNTKMSRNLCSKFTKESFIVRTLKIKRGFLEYADVLYDEVVWL